MIEKDIYEAHNQNYKCKLIISRFNYDFIIYHLYYIETYIMTQTTRQGKKDKWKFKPVIILQFKGATLIIHLP